MRRALFSTELQKALSVVDCKEERDWLKDIAKKGTEIMAAKKQKKRT